MYINVASYVYVTNVSSYSIVSALNKDFLTLDIQDHRFANVRNFLLDPSCSGSGVVTALNRASDNPIDMNPLRLYSRLQKRVFRIKSLIKVQEKMRGVW